MKLLLFKNLENLDSNKSKSKIKIFLRISNERIFSYTICGPEIRIVLK